MIDKPTTLRRNPDQQRRLLLHITAHLCQSLSFIAAIMATQAQPSDTGGGADQPQPRKTAKGKRKGGRKDALAAEAESSSTGSQEQTKPRAHWTEEETRTLVNYLYENRSKAGDGGFPPTVWHPAALHVKQHHPHERAKDAKQCETKYTQGVSRSPLPYQSLTDVETAQRHHGFYRLVQEVVGVPLGQQSWGQYRP